VLIGPYASGNRAGTPPSSASNPPMTRSMTWPGAPATAPSLRQLQLEGGWSCGTSHHLHSGRWSNTC
jgi:hypothetical protein